MLLSDLFPFLPNCCFRISERGEGEKEHVTGTGNHQAKSTEMRDLQGCVLARRTQILVIPWVNADFHNDDSCCGIFHTLEL